jgi:hypothetical protein
MPNNLIDVFISYSHDSREHEARILQIADGLRSIGIDVSIDRYQTEPSEGWQLWMETRIHHASFVLLACTEQYLGRIMREQSPGQGPDVLWEAPIIHSYLYDAGEVNEKFIPIVFGRDGIQFIPRPLESTSFYDLGTHEGFGDLYDRLIGGSYDQKDDHADSFTA